MLNLKQDREYSVDMRTKMIHLGKRFESLQIKCTMRYMRYMRYVNL